MIGDMAEYPLVFRVRQKFDGPQFGDALGEVEAELSRLSLGNKVKPGQSVAITAGSRGIANIRHILKAIVNHFKHLNAEPFIVPAMGSHGGGTAEGQRKILESYGVTEEFCGCPIRSSMETVVVCQATEGFPVHFDKLAYAADHVLVLTEYIRLRVQDVDFGANQAILVDGKDGKSVMGPLDVVRRAREGAPKGDMMVRKELGSARYWGPGGLAMTPTDRKILREDIDGFLPKQILDMHTHVGELLPGSRPRVSSLELVKKFGRMVFPGHTYNNLVIPLPAPHGIGTSAQANQSAWRQMQKQGDKQDAMLVFVEPGMTAATVRDQVLRYDAVGLKVYMTFATTKNKAEAPIRSFLPEKHIKVMDEMGLMVMLHLSKTRAISDPANIRDVVNLSKRYPNSKWVLAHCARCFRPDMLETVVDRLNACPNVYIECSAVCDPLVFITLFEEFDLSRVMFGSDTLCAAGLRGRYVEFGHFWEMIGRSGYKWTVPKLFPWQPTFVVYEQLRAMARAARRVGLAKKDIRNIFWNNAAKLIKDIRGERTISR